MTRLHELNLGCLRPVNGPPGPSGCRCLLIEDANGIALVDTGFGLAELQYPELIFGAEAAQKWHIEGDPAFSAVRQLENLGLSRRDVRHILCTHLDLDHAGGLVDFPEAQVHVSVEEHGNLCSGNPRYLSHQFAHGPQWVLSSDTETTNLFGMAARQVALPLADPVYFVPLFGHTRGHCGVAVSSPTGWLFHAGDSYYRRSELQETALPDSFQRTVADEEAGRVRALQFLRDFEQEFRSEARFFSTHDLAETTWLETIAKGQAVI